MNSYLTDSVKKNLNSHPKSAYDRRQLIKFQRFIEREAMARGLSAAGDFSRR